MRPYCDDFQSLLCLSIPTPLQASIHRVLFWLTTMFLIGQTIHFLPSISAKQGMILWFHRMHNYFLVSCSPWFYTTISFIAKGSSQGGRLQQRRSRPRDPFLDSRAMQPGDSMPMHDPTYVHPCLRSDSRNFMQHISTEYLNNHWNETNGFFSPQDYSTFSAANETDLPSNAIRIGPTISCWKVDHSPGNRSTTMKSAPLSGSKLSQSLSLQFFNRWPSRDVRRKPFRSKDIGRRTDCCEFLFPTSMIFQKPGCWINTTSRVLLVSAVVLGTPSLSFWRSIVHQISNSSAIIVAIRFRTSLIFFDRVCK